MLPPVAEIYVVWHPKDTAGAQVADAIVNYFHGTPFSGLIGGAIEAYVRSEGWAGPQDAPRPIPLPGRSLPNGLAEAAIVAVVPVLGAELATQCEVGSGPWHDYATEILDGSATAPDRVGVFPVVSDRAAVEHTTLGSSLGRFQRVGPQLLDPEVPADLRLACRDLAQGIAQLAGGGIQHRLTVFISHAKSNGSVGGTDNAELIGLVRSTIRQTRLREFFDAHDLQPGQDWSDALRENAATSAMLAVRTDEYASRGWCQWEMLTAKCAGMPVVTLDALEYGDPRGSFLMDHVPRVPVRRTSDGWRTQDIANGLDLLVDECLKQALWGRQQQLAQANSELEVTWWAPHAPEPATLVTWLASQRPASLSPLRILHPDPPLGPDEVRVLTQLAALAGVPTPLEILTPRSLAARGGW